MKNLSEEKVCQLAMSPLYVLYLVASEHVAPEQISERHIVRSMEYGLRWQLDFSEGIFELLRSNLHKFYANFPRDYSAQGRERWKSELLTTKDVLDKISAPPAMIVEFKEALTGLANFVARGGAFRQELQDAAMQRQAEWVEGVFLVVSARRSLTNVCPSFNVLAIGKTLLDGQDWRLWFDKKTTDMVKSRIEIK